MTHQQLTCGAGVPASRDPVLLQRQTQAADAHLQDQVHTAHHTGLHGEHSRFYVSVMVRKLKTADLVNTKYIKSHTVTISVCT